VLVFFPRFTEQNDINAYGSYGEFANSPQNLEFCLGFEFHFQEKFHISLPCQNLLCFFHLAVFHPRISSNIFLIFIKYIYKMNCLCLRLVFSERAETGFKLLPFVWGLRDRIFQTLACKYGCDGVLEQAL
jgi:hypothetical protein